MASVGHILLTSPQAGRHYSVLWIMLPWILRCMWLLMFGIDTCFVLWIYTCVCIYIYACICMYLCRNRHVKLHGNLPRSWSGKISQYGCGFCPSLPFLSLYQVPDLGYQMKPRQGLRTAPLQHKGFCPVSTLSLLGSLSAIFSLLSILLIFRSGLRVYE